MICERVWQFSWPSNNNIVGGSNSGKSTWVEMALQKPEIFERKVDKIYYYYGINSTSLRNIMMNFPDVIAIEGIPRNFENPLQIFSPSKNNLVIFDDLSSETQNSPDFTNFLVRGTHHANCCLISCEHFLFSDAKERRRQTPHWHQIILFQNKRCMHQIATLARQTSVGSPQLVQFAYKDATSRPYGYLVMDFRNDTPEEMRLLTNVLGENGDPTYVYI